MDLKMKNLVNCPEHFDTVCGWMWSYWGKAEGLTLNDIKYRTRHSMFRNRVPMTFVAILGKKPVAVASLWQNDLRSRQDITPYLAELYVLPKMQRMGIGAAMQRYIMECARKIGLKKIYLITSHPNYYERTGWKFIGTAPFHYGIKKRVYEHRL